MNASPPKAILFDLDDTLITQTETSETSWREIFDLYSPHFEESDRQKVLETILKSVHWFWSDPARHKRGRLDLRKARREIIAGVFLAQKIDNPLLGVMLARFPFSSPRRFRCPLSGRHRNIDLPP